LNSFNVNDRSPSEEQGGNYWEFVRDFALMKGKIEIRLVMAALIFIVFPMKQQFQFPFFF
jgi:hypothetical protein